MTFASQWTPAYAAISQWAVQGNKPGRSDVHLSIPTASIGEQQDAPFYARVLTKANALVLQADCYQLLVRVYDRAGNEVYGSEEDPLDVIFDTLQTGEPWNADGTGYNLAFTIPGRGVFLAGGADYRAEFMLELQDGDTIPMVGTLKVRPAYTYKKNQTQ